MEIDIGYIRKELQSRASERQLPRVHEATGVALSTMHRIIGGASCNTGTAQRLQEYLRRTGKNKKQGK